MRVLLCCSIVLLLTACATSGTVETEPQFSTTAAETLLDTAQYQREAGNVDSAAVVLERALRIEPRNPALLLELAELRLLQHQPSEAVALAKRARSLPGADARRADTIIKEGEASD